MPCQFEGCERHRESYSECLDRMPFERVRDALDELLARSLRPVR
jgi:heptosyltransferase-3